MRFELPADPSTVRRARFARWLSVAFAVLLIGLVAYFGYVSYEGSRQLAGHPSPSTDCRTPGSIGLTYEAINYDAATDAALAAEPDPEACVGKAGAAGEAIVTSDGIRIAGWYVPAAADIGPAGATVVLAHGWGANKSQMLDYIALLSERYNVVAFDQRNHGQSSGDQTTQGVLEQLDLRAVIDWLVATKAPQQIALFGVSMGGATAINEAVGDERVAAVVMDSTHARLGHAAQARLELAGYPLSLPGSWAVLLGGLLRTGQDMSAVDPVHAIARNAERPVLVIEAGQDAAIGPADGQELLEAAEAAGVDAELEICEPAGHAKAIEECPAEYREWVLGFLDRAFGAAAQARVQTH